MSYGALSGVRPGPCSLGKPGAWYVVVVAPERSHDETSFTTVTHAAVFPSTFSAAFWRELRRLAAVHRHVGFAAGPQRSAAADACSAELEAPCVAVGSALRHPFPPRVAC